MSQRGFAAMLVFIVAVVIGLAIFVGFRIKKSNLKPKQEQTQAISPVTSKAPELQTNPYWGTPCQSNSKPTFTHDLTDLSKISHISPPILDAFDFNKVYDRSFINLDPFKKNLVPVYSPVDADLVNGVYKDSRDNIDYDLHFQVSCEVWFFINHVSEPVEKVKKVFPKKPSSDTKSNNQTRINPPIHLKAGELIGYTSGTNQAHNWDFAVFDLNHVNKLPEGAEKFDTREQNFICPFDLFTPELKAGYIKKLDPQTPGSVCH